ncbi:hypothetical protein JCM1841_003812 [Sporobolomyces salmonicolor]
MVDAGYFLPSIPQTALLWACVVLGILYAALCVVLFFRLLKEAVSEGYMAPRNAKREEGEQTAEIRTEEQRAADEDRRVRRLGWISQGCAAVLAIFVACSIALFTLGLQTQLDEWNKFW